MQKEGKKALPTPDYKHIAALVSRAQSGDGDAFAEFYAATCQRQYRFACHYLKDEYLAQDALQETYITALKNLARLKDPDLALAWLNQINFHVCYKIHKKQQRYEMEMKDYEAASSPSPGSFSNNPEDEIIQIDSKKYIMNQILKLPFTETQVIILKYYHNMKHDEIARLMDISRSTVKRYLASAKEHLKKALLQ